MDSEQFLNELDDSKFSEVETNESMFDGVEKCVFKAKTLDKVKITIKASDWESVLSMIPSQYKVKCF